MALLAVVGLVLAGCSDDDGKGPKVPDGESTTTLLTGPPVEYPDPSNGMTVEVCVDVNDALNDLGESSGPLSERLLSLASVLTASASELPDEVAEVFLDAADQAVGIAADVEGFSDEEEATFEEEFNPAGTPLGDMAMLLVECPPEWAHGHSGDGGDTGTDS